MNIFFRRYLWGIIIAAMFFVVGIATLSHYGLNIDEPIHFIRGQSYLRLLTTGQQSYSPEDLAGKRVSAWKIQQYNGQYFLKNDDGHPPLNGILSALSNRIFYEQLGILGDLESYHAFEVLVASLLVFLIFVMGRDMQGVFTGVVAALSLILYPLFLGESHFNIKDPVETAFFAATVYFFYLGVVTKKAKFLLWSALSCGLALSTKFNIVFSPFIILPYLVLRFRFSKVSRSILFSLLLYPVIVLSIFYATWPYLWSDPIERLRDTITYYRIIGTGNINQPAFLFYRWNFYPPFFVLISTPLSILFFAGVGFFCSIVGRFNEKTKWIWLVLLWFIVPIVRVMWPGASIYSGVRQILEYVPALALLAGYGANECRKFLITRTGSRAASSLIIISSFIPISITMIRMHPNENLFFNSLIGGVSGAVARRIPGAAESMGNVYAQGIRWLNANAEPNARVGLPVGLLSNIPGQYIRKDIRFGAYFSASKQSGEYMMEMVSVDFPPPRYNFLYLDRIVRPVHVVEVGGTPILKIWKNEWKYMREEFLKEIQFTEATAVLGLNDRFVRIKLSKPRVITRVEIDYPPSGCNINDDGKVYYSVDHERLFMSPEDMNAFRRIYSKYPEVLPGKNTWYYFFPATEAKVIAIVPNDPLSCILTYTQVRVFGPEEKSSL